MGGEALLCFRLSNFVGIRRKFLCCKFQYMDCIYFHIMLLLSYRFCMHAMAIRYFFKVRVRCRASVTLGKREKIMTENNRDNSIYDSPYFRPFTNDKIFMNVMRSPKICRALLELILPNEEIGAIRIKKSENPFVDNSEIDEDLDGNMSRKQHSCRQRLWNKQVHSKT